MVERYRTELAEGIPEVTGWFGVIDETVASSLVAMLKAHGATEVGSAGRRARESGSYAYLKISDGCDEKCTFCAIPSFKGTYSPLRASEILEEAERCLADGARELILVGQDTTRWTDGDLDLAGLIDALSADQRVNWVRVMYLQPTRVTGAFFRFMSDHHKLCAYLDIPFQHSHEEVLRRMGRPGNRITYLDLLRHARSVVPGVSVRSTFIVGFPGEEEHHFEDLLGFVDAGMFDYGGAFVYSPEEGTTAAGLGPVVPASVAGERLNELNERILAVGERARMGMVGRTLEVMIDEVDWESEIEGAFAVGRTRGQAPEIDGVTYVMGDKPARLAPGETVTVRIQEVMGCDFVGEAVAS